MTDSSPWTLINPATKRIEVAIYAGGGSTITPGLVAYPGCLVLHPADIVYTYIGPLELAQPHLLEPFDVVVFPGGGGHSQAEAIGEAGVAAVKAFVKGGGGYVSSCAGPTWPPAAIHGR